MNVAKIATLGLALVVCAGCTANLDVAGDKWMKAGANLNQVTLDELQCVRGATDAGQTPDLIVGGVVDAARFAVREAGRTHSYNRCMTARGYAEKSD